MWFNLKRGSRATDASLRRDLAQLSESQTASSEISNREAVVAVVQTFGMNAMKRSGALHGSCGENCIPDFGRRFVFDAKLSEFELTFSDPVHQFNASNGN